MNNEIDTSDPSITTMYSSIIFKSESRYNQTYLDDEFVQICNVNHESKLRTIIRIKNNILNPLEDRIKLCNKQICNVIRVILLIVYFPIILFAITIYYMVKCV